MYAKLINNQIIYAPINYETDESIIVNFNKNEELMKEYGFKEVIDTKPEYDFRTHYIVVSDYTEDEINIFVNYNINEIENNNTPSLKTRVFELEKLNTIQNDLLDATVSAIENINTMLEPLLVNTLVDNKTLFNPLINIYVTMINTGYKTKEQIPEQYREQVEEVLSNYNME